MMNNEEEQKDQSVELEPKNQSKDNLELREHYCFLLVSVYEKNEEDLKNLTIDELKKMLEKEQEKKAAAEKNPNRFWMIKGMPEPKTFKPKTSAKAGIMVVVAFVLMLLLIGVVFFLLAFRPWQK